MVSLKGFKIRIKGSYVKVTLSNNKNYICVFLILQTAYVISKNYFK